MNWLLFVSIHMKDIWTQWGWVKMADIFCSRPWIHFLPRTYICNVIILNFVPNKCNCIGQGNDLTHNRIQNVTWTNDNPVHWPTHLHVCVTSHNEVMSYKRFVYYLYLVMGIPQSQVTSEFSWDRDICVEPWCFLCCKPERDVEQTVVWSVKWDSLTSS